MTMQQLSIRNTFTPKNASLVLGNCDPLLNKEETLSVVDLKTIDNNPEGKALQHTGDQNLRVSDNVYVLSMRGKPLMPMTPKKARSLLQSNKAKIIERKPFTIQLLYSTGETKQEITLGIDSGSKNIGFSAVSSKKELLSGTLMLDQNMSKHLQEKKMYRRGRRNKLWYRQPRFLNRKRNNRWLPPSVERKYQTHLTLIGKIKNILPIDKINIEVGLFDIQKINNPEIQGTEYQQGDLYQYENMRAFLLYREQGKCQICGKDGSKDRFVVHHIIQRNEGGTDRVDNLCLLHNKCHKLYHEGKKKIVVKRNKQYKDSTFMNIIRKRFIDNGCYNIIYGYETSVNRKALGLEKSHSNDAFVIAGGIEQSRNIEYSIIQRRRNNRSLQLNRKGYERSIRREKYKYQPGDEIIVDEKRLEVVGTHCKGKRVMVRREKEKNNSVRVDRIERHYRRKGWEMLLSPA